MTDADSSPTDLPGPRCECGYLCVGATVEERVLDGQHHARTVHRIEVSRKQVLAHDRAGATPEGEAE